MNAYEEKQEEKRQRYLGRSKKAEDKSSSCHKQSRAISEHIPFGQPILVGHHSEGRARSDQNKLWKLADRAVKESDKSEYYAGKAESVGTGGISSDDPDAVVKLKEKMAGLVEGQEYMKKINAEYRRCKGDISKMDGISDKERERLLVAKDTYYLGQGRFKPFERFSLSNNNANIRRIKMRIKELEKLSTMTASEPTLGSWWRIEECPDDNRIRFYFTDKPNAEIRTELKRNGFKYSPRNNHAWQRFLANGRYPAKHVHNWLLENYPNAEDN